MQLKFEIGWVESDKNITRNLSEHSIAHLEVRV